MGLIDTHTHLDSFARSGELAAILQRARAAGLEQLVTIGTDTDDWTLYRNLAREHLGFVRYSAGLHPCSVGEDWAERVAQLEGFWSKANPPDEPGSNAAHPEDSPYPKILPAAPRIPPNPRPRCRDAAQPNNARNPNARAPSRGTASNRPYPCQSSPTAPAPRRGRAAGSPAVRRIGQTSRGEYACRSIPPSE